VSPPAPVPAPACNGCSAIPKSPAQVCVPSAQYRAGLDEPASIVATGITDSPASK
jgi:hypothetical protein